MLTKSGVSPIELLTRDGFVVGGAAPKEAVDDLNNEIRNASFTPVAVSGTTTQQFYQLPIQSSKPLLHCLPPEMSEFEVVAALAAVGNPVEIGTSGEDWVRQATVLAEDSGKRAYVAYVGLSDESGPQGQLRVVRNSHRLSPSERSVGAAGVWSAHAKRLDRVAVDLPLDPGRVVILDPAIVWSRHLNHSCTERVGVYLLLVEPGSTMVRYGDLQSEISEHELAGQLIRLERDVEARSNVARQEVSGSLAEWVRAQSDLYATRVARVALIIRLSRGLKRAPGRVWGTILRVAARCLKAARSVSDRVAEFRDRLNERRRKVVNAATAVTRSVRESPQRLEVRRRRATQKFMELVGFAPSAAAIVLLQINEWAICRFGPKTPAVWDPAQFDWTVEVEEAWPAIRSEVEDLLNHRKAIPHIEDVTGGIPQGNEGVWRTFVLMHQGAWIDWNCSRCPETTKVVERIPQLSMAGFSVLEPGTHITEHRGPNKGALRYQLGVIVPGAEGDCRIRVGDEMLFWRDGESIIFDFTVPHEAWNDTEQTRVVLMLEFHTPLPAYLALPNSMVQRCMAWFPATRDMKKRLLSLEPTLDKGRAA